MEDRLPERRKPRRDEARRGLRSRPPPHRRSGAPCRRRCPDSNDRRPIVPVTIALLPMPLRWLQGPQSWHVPDEASLHVAAGPRTDWFVDPQRPTEATMNAPALVGPSSGDFLLSARVTVDFAATYDAGVLVLHERDDLWAKVCFEYSPDGEPMVVSVVTRGVSDDCNSFVVDGASVW